MKHAHIPLSMLLLGLAASSVAQTNGGNAGNKTTTPALPNVRREADQAETSGVRVEVKSIATFRGVVANQLMGFGLVTGLNATGDTKRFLASQSGLINILRKYGLQVDPATFESKNVALVAITSELPAFSAPGQRLEVSLSTLGDCTSLRGGTLLFSTLQYPGKDEVYATASGAITVGGNSSAAGGNASSRGHTTVGNIPGGAIVQRSVPTTIVFDNKMYLDLQNGDAVTASRIEQAINEKYPDFHAVAISAGTIQVDLPNNLSPNTAQARLGEISVMADSEAKVVIDEKTGTIVIGGNVRIAPCAIAKGSLSVRVMDEVLVSQPNPLGNGSTVVANQQTLSVREQTTQIAVLRPNTTVADLAAIFQTLQLKADDVINILRALYQQGALKARLEVR